MRFLDNSRPRVFAHRGGCALGPENTLAAFDRGHAAGADGFELDVHLSADGVVVVCHDATLERTTDAAGPLAARTAADLALVDAGHRFVDAAGAFPFRGLGVGIPTLSEVLQRYPEARWAVYRSIARWPVRKARYDAFQVPETAGVLRIVSPRFVRDVHAAGCALQVWTVDEERDMDRLLSWGVDGLISNRPDVAVRVRDAFLRGVRPQVDRF